MLSSVQNGNGNILNRPEIGHVSPDFITFDQNEESVSLFDYKKKRVLLVFADPYVDFEQNLTNLKIIEERYDELNIEVLVATTHKRNFFPKDTIQHLKFISHSDMKIFHAYGVLNETNAIYLGRPRVENISFLIEQNHKIEKIIPNKELIKTLFR